MLTAHEEIRHLAEIDAFDLVASFTSRDFNGKANAAWYRAANDARLTASEERSLRTVYLAALVESCALLAKGGA